MKPFTGSAFTEALPVKKVCDLAGKRWEEIGEPAETEPVSGGRRWYFPISPYDR
jgi:hypothetical protein